MNFLRDISMVGSSGWCFSISNALQWPWAVPTWARTKTAAKALIIFVVIFSCPVVTTKCFVQPDIKCSGDRSGTVITRLYSPGSCFDNFKHARYSLPKWSFLTSHYFSFWYLIKKFLVRKWVNIVMLKTLYVKINKTRSRKD